MDVVMIRQILNIFAVTLALVAAAVVSAMILELQVVQAYLGIAGMPGMTAYFGR